TAMVTLMVSGFFKNEFLSLLMILNFTLNWTHFVPILMCLPHFLGLPNPWIWLGVLVLALIGLTNGKLELDFQNKLVPLPQKKFETQLQLGKVYWTASGIEVEIREEIRMAKYDYPLLALYLTLVFSASLIHWSFGITTLMLGGSLFNLRDK
nr:putative non-structural protein NS2b [Tamana bat virus]